MANENTPDNTIQLNNQNSIEDIDEDEMIDELAKKEFSTLNTKRYNKNRRRSFN